MNNYQDQWGRFHHKPCINGEPSSGNGWIFTAYADKAGVPIGYMKLFQCSKLCITENGSFNRSPGKNTPPISRDEILGLVALNLTNKSEDWNFSPYPLPKFSPLKLVKQLWELRPSVVSGAQVFNRKDSRVLLVVGERVLLAKHRNYFWQNNLDQLYRFAFSVPVQDRYYILKKWGKFRFYKPSHLFYAAVAAVDKLGPASGIRFLKYGGEKNKEAMVKEFPEDHPITFTVKR